MEVDSTTTLAPLPLIKEDLLREVDRLNYRDRIARAALLGKQHATSPQLQELIKDLRTHPPPDAPNMEVEEEFVKILPPQQTNNKFYHEDHIALTAAMASGSASLPVLHQEVQSPSLSFKKLACKGFVKHQKDDQILYDTIIAAPPSVAKKLLHQCVKYRRVAVLERCVPVLLDRDGIPVIAGFLHGCSSTVVAARLANPLILTNKKLKWKELARYHSQIIIDLIRKDLSEFVLKSWDDSRQSVWTKWQDRIGKRYISKELLRNAHMTSELLKLHEEYPVQVLNKPSGPSTPAVSATPAEWIKVQLPSFIEGNLDYFFQKHSKEMVAYYLGTIKVGHSGNLESQIPDQFWNGSLTKRLSPAHAFELLMQMIEGVFNKSTPKSLYTHRLLDDLAAKLVSNSIFKAIKEFYLTCENLQQIADVVMGFLMKNKPTAKSFTDWQMTTEEKSLSQAISMWKGWCKALYTQLIQEMHKREEKLLAKEELLEKEELPSAGLPVSKPRAKAGGRQSGAGGVGTYRNVREAKRQERLRQKRPRTPKRKTPEEKEAEKKALAASKLAVVNSLKEFLRRLVALITDEEWRWMDDGAEQLSVGVAGEERRRVEKDRVKEELQRRRDEGQQLLGRLPDIGILHPEIVMTIFEAFLYFAEGQTLEERGWYGIFKGASTQFLRALHSTVTSTNKRVNETLRTVAQDFRNKVFDYFYTTFAETPVAMLSQLVELGSYGSPEQNMKIFRSFSSEQLEYLGQQSPANLMKLISNVFHNYDAIRNSDEETDPMTDYTIVWEAVQTLLNEADISEDTKDSLKAYQNIKDAAIKKVLIKAMDSNSITERSAAIETLLKSALLTRSATHVKQTLSVLQQKIKNENLDTRVEILRVITGKVSKHHSIMLSVECQPVWKTMLQDALEAPDTEVRQIEVAFRPVSEVALLRGAKDTETSGLFDFGVDLQWTLAKHSLGNKKCFTDFRISLPGISLDSENLPLGRETSFVNAVVKAYKEKISEKSEEAFTEFMKDVPVLKPLYRIVKKYWHTIPALCDHVRLAIENIKELKKDKDGLYLLEADDDEKELFDEVFGEHKREDWNAIPVLREFVDTVLRSRQAPDVVFDWLALNSTGKTKEERRANREACVFKLLEISPSAIYLRFVWRHLVRYRQDKLDEFINAKKSFRGVFYVEPEKRNIKKKKGKKSAKRSPLLLLRKLSAGSLAQILEKEDEAEADLEADRQEFEESNPSGEEFDHPDFFCIEGCYGLRRLLPRQSEQLAQQRLRQIMNGNRALPDRVRSTIRWTLLPTTEYKEIVQFYEQYNKGDTKLAVNIIEAALRGAMECPERCVPLHFLLSPKFLSTDRARVASFAIGRCIPHMHAKQLTEALRMALTPTRRRLLKVTAYKEIIRLLASRPTLQHLNMIYKEWKREQLHRDLKVVIIHKAFGFLNIPEGEMVGWSILESALENTDPEILVALLCGIPEKDSAYYVRDTGVCRKSRLHDHLHEMKNFTVAKRHRKRFLQNVLLPLCRTTVDDDVANLATVQLPRWLRCVSMQKDMIEQLQKIVTNLSKEVLFNPKSDVQVIHNTRYTSCLNGIFNLCGVTVDNKNTKQSDELKAILVQTVEILITAVKEIPRNEREMRQELLRRIELFSKEIPSSPTSYFSATQLDTLSAPLRSMGPLYWQFFTTRKINALQQSLLDHENQSAEINKLIHSVFLFVSENSTHQDWAIESLMPIFKYNSVGRSVRKTMKTNLIPAIEDLIKGTLVEVSNPLPPKYLHLMRLLTLRVLKNTPSFFYSHVEAVTDYLFKMMAFAGDQEKTWSVPGTWILNNIEGIVKAILAKGKTSSHITGETLKAIRPEAINLVIKIVDFWLADPANTHNSLAVHYCREIVLNMMKDSVHTQILTWASSDKLLRLMHHVINHYAAQPTFDTDTAFTPIKNLLDAIDSVTRQERKKTEIYVLNSEIQSPTLFALEAFFGKKLLTADPVPLPHIKAAVASSTLIQQAPPTCPAFDNAWLLLSMALLEKYPTFVHVKEEAGKKLLHHIIVWAVCYNGDIPAQSPDKVRKKLSALLMQGWRDTIFTETYTFGTMEYDMNKGPAKKILAYISSLQSLSLMGEGELRVEHGRSFLLGPYRNFCQHLALDLLVHFGDSLTIKAAVDPMVEDEEPEKSEKEKEKDTEQGKGKDKGKDKGGKKKKEKDFDEMVWRPEYEAMLDSFCEDTDQSVAWRALAVTTRSVKAKDKPSTSGLSSIRRDRFSLDWSL